jgi:hypothetical protein
MKAFVASDRNGDSGYSIIVFAETAGQAKAYARDSETFDSYEFTEMRVNRCKALDSYYRGKPEMDWLNYEDRVAMVRCANFECSCEVCHPECENGECPAQEWCGRYERMKDDDDGTD